MAPNITSVPHDVPQETCFLHPSHPGALSNPGNIPIPGYGRVRGPQISSSNQIGAENPDQYPTQAHVAAPFEVASQKVSNNDSKNNHDNPITTKADPTRITTWGPKTYTRSPEAPASDIKVKLEEMQAKKKGLTTVNGYKIGAEAADIGDKSSGDPATRSNRTPGGTRRRLGQTSGTKKDSKEPEKSQGSVITVWGSEESTTLETEEKFKNKDGKAGTRKTWVTLARITVVEEEVLIGGEKEAEA